MKWLTKYFNERQIKEIEFCQIYAENFSHGTDGHNAKLIISKLVDIIHEIENTAEQAQTDTEFSNYVDEILDR